MKFANAWRLIVVALLVALALPVGRADAAGRKTQNERGATVVAIGERTTTVGGRTLPSSRQGESVIVVGEGFAVGELIGLWLTLPDYSVISLDDDDLVADAAGAFVVELSLASSLPTGTHHFSARGQTTGRGGIAPFFLAAGRGPQPSGGAVLQVAPAAARQQEVITVTALGFTAGEQIAFWLTLHDDAVVSLGTDTAGSNGLVSFALELPSFLPVGRHYFTAFGKSSGNTAIVPFTLQYGNGLAVPGARLAVNVGSAPQRSLIQIAGTGFTGGETVSFWLTQPDGAVLELGSVQTASNGSIDALIYADETLPIGRHYLSFRGDASGLSGFATFILNAGPTEPGRE